MNDLRKIVTYRRFTDHVEADELVAFLSQHGIECRVKNNTLIFDVTFSNNPLNTDLHVEMRGSDFAKADLIIQTEMEKDLKDAPADYYLFSFSEEELYEVLVQRDKWSAFDFVLAKKLLADRGRAIDVSQLKELQNRRLEELKQPETDDQWMVYLGYASALSTFFNWSLYFIGFTLGLTIGIVLMYRYKTLPTGARMRVYENKRRKHGLVIVILTLLGFALTLIVFQVFPVFELFY